MNAQLARWLVRCYPRAWRRRYGAEFQEFLQESAGGLAATANVLRSAVGEHWQCVGAGNWPRWLGRAPGVVFGLGPLALLGVIYLVACVQLWLGWQLFLGGIKTPFVPVGGFAAGYFAVGRGLYQSGPVVAAWVLAGVAIRVRPRAVWLALGWVASGLIGSMARVYATPSGPAGSIGMEFRWDGLAAGHFAGPLHALVIILLGALPYVSRSLLWAK